MEKVNAVSCGDSPSLVSQHPVPSLSEQSTHVPALPPPPLSTSQRQKKTLLCIKGLNFINCQRLYQKIACATKLLPECKAIGQQFRTKIWFIQCGFSSPIGSHCILYGSFPLKWRTVRLSRNAAQSELCSAPSLQWSPVWNLRGWPHRSVYSSLRVLVGGDLV